MKLLQELPPDAKKAIVILVKTKNDNVRYFHDFKKNRFVNAWSLAGAKLFLEDNPELKFVENALRKKGYSFERQIVELSTKN